MNEENYEYNQQYQGQRFARQQQMDRQPRNDFEALESVEKGTVKNYIFASAALVLAVVEVLIMASAAPLWVQDIMCIFAIEFGVYAAVSSNAKGIRWIGISATVLAACSLVGTMCSHSIYGVIFQAFGSL